MKRIGPGTWQCFVKGHRAGTVTSRDEAERWFAARPPVPAPVRPQVTRRPPVAVPAAPATFRPSRRSQEPAIDILDLTVEVSPIKHRFGADWYATADYRAYCASIDCDPRIAFDAFVAGVFHNSSKPVATRGVSR